MYSRYAKEYETAIIDNIYNANLERPSLLSMLPDLKGKSVLDLGCGPGIYAEYLLNQGARVTATDISGEMIEIVNRKFGSTVPCYVQDLSNGLPEECDSSYDLIICPLAIHYIEDLTRLLADVRRVLKDTGFFVFSTHHPLLDFKSSPSGNYFKRERITQEWHTIGRPVQVQFFRRSLTELFRAISASGMYVSDLYEGKPTTQVKQASPETYEHLSKRPFFIFIKCQVSS